MMPFWTFGGIRLIQSILFNVETLLFALMILDLLICGFDHFVELSTGRLLVSGMRLRLSILPSFFFYFFSLSHALAPFIGSLVDVWLA
jgi:hypothetical protein